MLIRRQMAEGRRQMVDIIVSSDDGQILGSVIIKNNLKSPDPVCILHILKNFGSAIYHSSSTIIHHFISHPSNRDTQRRSLPHFLLQVHTYLSSSTQVTPPSMPREEDFSRIKRKPNRPKKAASSSEQPAPSMMPTPFSRVPIHEQFEKDLVRHLLLHFRK